MKIEYENQCSLEWSKEVTKIEMCNIYEDIKCENASLTSCLARFS